MELFFIKVQETLKMLFLFLCNQCGGVVSTLSGVFHVLDGRDSLITEPERCAL